MLNRFFFGAILVAGLAGTFTGCSNIQVGSIQISPTTSSLAVNQTVQFSATGIVGHGSHPASSQDVTSQVAWSSSTPAVATINSSGLATAVSAGTTTISASMAGSTGATATITVTAGSGGATTAASLTIIPGNQSVASPGQTSQFIAIGTAASGATEDLTAQVAWSSSSVQVATISAGGLATGVSQGSTTITAILTSPSGSVVTGTAGFTVTGGTSEQITALTVYPGSQAANAQAQQTQFFVSGAQGSSGLLYDVTSQVVWTSSDTAVATVGTTGSGTPGQATAVGAGSTTIIATWTNLDGTKVVGNATYTVTIGAAQEPLISINIVPGGITVSNKGMTGQFLAFGTYSTTPTVRDLTDQVTWISTSPEVASIESGGVTGAIGGLATAQGYTGNSILYAESTNPDGTIVLSNPQTFTCLDPNTKVCDQEIANPQLATLTIYNAGENTTTWLVTAPSDTGIPNLIHCGPGWTGAGGSVCTGTYATGSTVVLTESPTGSGFGGWSSGDGVAGVGCQEANLTTSPTCTITLNGNTSVGAIFY